MKAIVSVYNDGIIRIPINIRKSLNISDKDYLQIETTKDGLIILKPLNINKGKRANLPVI